MISSRKILEMKLDAEELLRRYTTFVYFRTGSYVSAARKLGLDRRTVKARIDAEFLTWLQTASEEGR